MYLKKDKLLTGIMLLGGAFFWLDILGVYCRGQSSRWMAYWLYKIQSCSFGLLNFNELFQSMYASNSPSFLFFILSSIWFGLICFILSRKISILNYCISAALIFGHGQSVMFGTNAFSFGYKPKNVVEYAGYCLLVCTIFVYSMDSLFSSSNKVEKL